MLKDGAHTVQRVRCPCLSPCLLFSIATNKVEMLSSKHPSGVSNVCIAWLWFSAFVLTHPLKSISNILLQLDCS